LIANNRMIANNMIANNRTNAAGIEQLLVRCSDPRSDFMTPIASLKMLPNRIGVQPETSCIPTKAKEVNPPESALEPSKIVQDL
jgi:hypothetical protein